MILIRKYTTRCCAGILILFMGSIFLRFFTRNILIEKLGMHNAFTRAVFFDSLGLETEIDDPFVINWSDLYPFNDSSDTTAVVVVEDKSSGLKDRIDSIKRKIEDYTDGHLINRQMFVELAAQYEKSFGWNNISTTGEIIIDLGDGYLTVLLEKNAQATTSALAAGFSAFHEFLQTLGVDLLYVQVPCKTAPDNPANGVMDFSNENADDIIAALSLQGIPCLDLRRNIREEHLEHHRLFYKTDHHWNVETGLWASAVLVNYLNDNYGFNSDTRLAALEHYRAEVYADWFLGAYGRGITLVQTPPEDFTLLSPLFDTDVSLTIPELNIDIRGGFDVLIDYRHLERKDYYKLDPYAAYMHGSHTFITAHNNRVHDGRKILLIKDSFAGVVSPFLSMMVEDLHIMDLRGFNGSIKTYIAEHLPDIVIVMYSPSIIHLGSEKMFDFR